MAAAGGHATGPDPGLSSLAFYTIPGSIWQHMAAAGGHATGPDPGLSSIAFYTIPGTIWQHMAEYNTIQ